MNQFQRCLSFCSSTSWSPAARDSDAFNLSSNYLIAQGASTPVEAPTFESNPSPQDIDFLMAKEMAAMSIKEREVAENEVHGIGEDLEESQPGIMDNCLAEMDLNLEEMKKGTAYELAEKMSKEYVCSRDLRAMFIRTDRWNTWEASERMIRFFELKRDLFGDDMLVKDIHLEDLDEDDMKCLRGGHHQLSPHKDSAGRAIVVSLLALRKKCTSVKSMFRSTFYMYMSAVESTESQRKGVIMVHYTVDNPLIRAHYGDFRRALPVHTAANHFCYNDPVDFARGTITVARMTRVQRARFRRHFGNHLECLYKLKSYGIPENALPVTTSGELLTSYHLFWLETRRSMEQVKRLARRGPLTSKGDAITLPVEVTETALDPMSGSGSPFRQNDVLFGRGKTGHDHPGNLRFREFIVRSIKQFEHGTKSEKMSLTQTVVDLVKASGGRFLIKKEGSKDWEEFGFGASARKRVLAAFKNRLKTHKNVNPVPPVTSSS